LGLQGRGWNSWYLNNHDQPRMVSRFGNDKNYRLESAKLLATLLHTLQGTPYIYQGEEIGMTNVAFDTIADYRDLETLNMYREQVIEKGALPKNIMQSIHVKSRDNARTPMQWNDKENAGFSTAKPWIKVNQNYHEINTEQAMADPNSIFYYYRRLIGLRKENPTIVYGDYVPLLDDDPQIFAYLRRLAEDCLLVILNFSDQDAQYKFSELASKSKQQLLISNYEVLKEADIAIELRAYEARVYRVK
jgi:oligo-1,6-glucosidase